MLQIVKAVLKEKNSGLKMSLIFANQTEEDILCREDLEKVASENPDQFKLWYTLDRPPTGIVSLYSFTAIPSINFPPL